MNLLIVIVDPFAGEKKGPVNWFDKVVFWLAISLIDVRNTSVLLSELWLDF
jgi:hypothetical protein